jgi:hypothetical protein
LWGAVHPTHCALPHLKKSGGKIFVNSSSAAVLAMPGMSSYNVHLLSTTYTDGSLSKNVACIYSNFSKLSIDITPPPNIQFCVDKDYHACTSFQFLIF